MNDKFDEMTKGLAQSVTRRGALKKFGLCLAGSALTLLGLVDSATAGKLGNCQHRCYVKCKNSFPVDSQDFQICYNFCIASCI